MHVVHCSDLNSQIIIIIIIIIILFRMAPITTSAAAYIQFISGLVTFEFYLLTLKVVSESRVTWPISVPILVFLGLSSYAQCTRTDRQTDRETDVRHDVCQTSDKSIAGY